MQLNLHFNSVCIPCKCKSSYKIKEEQLCETACLRLGQNEISSLLLTSNHLYGQLRYNLKTTILAIQSEYKQLTIFTLKIAFFST